MRKLTYWVSPAINASHAYNLRSKRRKDIVDAIRSGGYTRGDYGPIKKVEVGYEDVFDLINVALSENGPFWEL